MLIVETGAGLPDGGAIYAIRNTFNHKVYIGSAVNLRRRIVQHFSKLRLGSHHSRKLQSAWNKYGENSFSVEVLERIENHNDLLQAEQKWIDSFDAAGRNGYNINPTAGSTLGSKRTPEQKERIAFVKRGVKRQPFSKNWREALSKSGKGRVVSEETREKLSKAQVGISKPDGQALKIKQRMKLQAVKLGPEYYSRISKMQSQETRSKCQQGKSLSDEHKAKIRSKNLCRVHTDKAKFLMSEAAILRHSRKTNEERSAIIRKAWETRRANMGVSNSNAINN